MGTAKLYFQVDSFHCKKFGLIFLLLVGHMTGKQIKHWSISKFWKFFTDKSVKNFVCLVLAQCYYSITLCFIWLFSSKAYCKMCCKMQKNCIPFLYLLLTNKSGYIIKKNIMHFWYYPLPYLVCNDIIYWVNMNM